MKRAYFEDGYVDSDDEEEERRSRLRTGPLTCKRCGQSAYEIIKVKRRTRGRRIHWTYRVHCLNRNCIQRSFTLPQL